MTQNDARVVQEGIGRGVLQGVVRRRREARFQAAGGRESVISANRKGDGCARFPVRAVRATLSGDRLKGAPRGRVGRGRLLAGRGRGRLCRLGTPRELTNAAAWSRIQPRGEHEPVNCLTARRNLV